MSEKPQILFACCKQVLEAKFQPGLLDHMPGYFLLTCLSESCPLQGFTFANISYPPSNLEVYLTDKARKEARQLTEVWGDPSEWHR